MERKLQALGLAVLGTVILLGCGAQNVKEADEIVPEYVFTYAENQPEGYPTTLGAYRFAELVYERTKGRIRIDVHAGGVLGDEVSVIEQLKFGGIDFTRASLMTVGEFEPKMNILQLPYLYHNSDHMWKVLDGEIGEEFMRSLEPSGLQALSWYDAGARHFYTTEPLNTLEDMKDRRIRVAESELMEAVITALGGVPVPMAYADVFSALEVGSIDGAENNWSSYAFTGHYKVAAYMTLDGHNRIPEMQLASRATWVKLSASDQRLLKQCAMESAIYERKLWAEQEDESRQLAEQNGVVTTELSDAELKRFREAVEPVYEKYGGDYQEVIEKIRVY